jgi:molybdopterin-guanine dinucleotide biosynthesis protein A
MSTRRPSGFALPAAIVLAGGRSTRMGGGDKGLRLLHGRPLLWHVLNRLARQASAIAISANGDPSRFAEFGLPVLADRMDGYLGPLAGLLTGLEWGQKNGTSHVVTAPTDSPFIPHDLVAQLSVVVEQAPDRPALAASGSRIHPVVGLWPVALAGRLRDFLASGTTYRVSDFANRCGAVPVNFPMIQSADRTINPFFNVNTPDDLAKAETMFEELSR